jgi:hypothetical protein
MNRRRGGGLKIMQNKRTPRAAAWNRSFFYNPVNV